VRTLQPRNFRKEKPGHLGQKHALGALGQDNGRETALAVLAVQEPEPDPILTALFGGKPLAADIGEHPPHTGFE